MYRYRCYFQNFSSVVLHDGQKAKCRLIFWCFNLISKRTKRLQTRGESSRGLPSFCQATVGVGAPEIGTSILSGSPARTRISRPPRADRSTFGGAIREITRKKRYETDWRWKENFWMFSAFLFTHVWRRQLSFSLLLVSSQKCHYTII